MIRAFIALAVLPAALVLAGAVSRSVDVPSNPVSGGAQTPGRVLLNTPPVGAVVTPDTEPGPEPDAARGLALFAERCASCHGPYGRGDGPLVDRLDGPPPDFADPAVAGALVPADAFEVVTLGRLERLMPPFGNLLSEEERWDVVAAVLGMRLTPERLARSRPAFDQLCGECHVSGSPPGLLAADMLELSADTVRQSLSADHHRTAALTTASAARRAEAADFALASAFTPLPFAGLQFDASLHGVVRRQPDDSPVAGQPIRIAPFVHTFPSGVITITTADSGEFSATELARGPGVVMAISTEFESVEYTAVVTDTSAVNMIELTVYGTTYEAPLTASSARILLSPDPSAAVVHAVELWTITNPLSQTLTAAPGEPTLSFQLPPGATGARFGDPGRDASSTMGDTLTTASPVLPGASQITFEYAVPYDADRLAWQIATVLRVDDVRFAVVGDGVTVEAEAAVVTEGQAGGERVIGATFGALEPGTTLTLTLAGLPLPLPAAMGGAAGAPMGTAWAAYLAAVSAGMGVATALTYRRWGRSAARARRAERLRRTRSALLDDVADLDRRWTLGGIDSMHYRQERASTMDALMRATRSMEQGDSE